MCNPTLYRHKVFNEQVKLCLNNTFGLDKNNQINVILKRPNTRVIALIINYEHGSYSTRKNFKVLSFVVYTIIDKYVCIVFLIDLMLSNIVTYDMNITSDDFINKKKWYKR